MRIAIIGLGISGASVLKHLYDLDLINEDVKIDIYEPFNEPIVGKAYQHDSSVLLMNSYSKRLSLNENNPDDFIEWLREYYPEFQDDDFAPRHIYGEYLTNFYGKYLQMPEVTLLQEEVTDIQILDSYQDQIADNQTTSSYRYGVSTDNHPNIEIYDYLFLTIGHMPYGDPYHLLGNHNFIHTPYPVHQQLRHIDGSKRIGIIGSGLTGLDVMHYLQVSKELTHPVTFYIRHEPFTNVKSKLYDKGIVLTLNHEWIDNTRKKFDGQIPLIVMWQQLMQDMKDNGVDLLAAIDKYQTGTVFNMRYEIKENPLDLQIIQRYIGLLTAYLPELNMALSPQDRKLFHQKYKRLFEHFRTQFPAIKMQKIIDWLDSGKVKIIMGLEDIKSTEDNMFELTTNTGKQYHCDVLVNATGFENNLEKASKISPLINSLYSQEIITQNPLGGFQVTWPYCHPISPRYGEIKGIFVSGLVIGTTQFGNNNAQMTALHGKNMVIHLKNQL